MGNRKVLAVGGGGVLESGKENRALKNADTGGLTPDVARVFWV